MEKIWYLKFYEQKEGPYSVLDLKRDPRVKPDTLVWRQGFDSWQQIRYVPELQKIFEEDEESLENESPKLSPEDDELVLELAQNQPNRWLMIAIVLIIALYLWLRAWN